MARACTRDYKGNLDEVIDHQFLARKLSDARTVFLDTPRRFRIAGRLTLEEILRLFFVMFQTWADGQSPGGHTNSFQ
jgi:hypothetical protein